MCTLPINICSASISFFLVLCSTDVQGDIARFGEAQQIYSQHITLNCAEDIAAVQIQDPFSQAGLSDLTSVTYQEQYFQLGCANAGFQGYFDAHRWAEVREITNVPTGEAALLLQQGDKLLRVRGAQRHRFEFILPADGYFSFNWTYTQQLGVAQLEVLVNGEPMDALQHDGKLITPTFQQGDRLSFVLPQEARQAYLLDDFTFFSNASGVYERQWFASDAQDTRYNSIQLITIERPNLTDVRIPADQEIAVDGPDLNLNPQHLGIPYLAPDAEKNIDERQELGSTYCDMDVYWQDHIEYTPEGMLIRRQWTITDFCNGSTIDKVQTIKLYPTSERWIPTLESLTTDPSLTPEANTSPRGGFNPY